MPVGASLTYHTSNCSQDPLPLDLPYPSDAILWLILDHPSLMHRSPNRKKPIGSRNSRSRSAYSGVGNTRPCPVSGARKYQCTCRLVVAYEEHQTASVTDLLGALSATASRYREMHSHHGHSDSDMPHPGGIRRLRGEPDFRQHLQMAS